MRSAAKYLLSISLLVGLAGCGGFGKVNQGRVIHYDPEKGLVTLIPDSNSKDPGNPKYDVLPPVTIQVPDDPAHMGPAPEAGNLMFLDIQQHSVVIFDDGSRSLKSIECRLIEQKDNVFRDDPRVAKTPVVDRARKAITVYLPRQRQLVTFHVPDEYFALPDNTWKAGDEVRYYYKDPNKALKLMNVTKTDIV